MSGEALLARVVAAVGVNAVLAGVAYKTGGVRRSGVAAGFLIGVVIYLGLGWRGYLILVGMYTLGTALTRLGYARKERLGAAEAKRGARGASHALANAGPAALVALVAGLSPSPVWPTAFVAALATSAMDTAGSEVGPLWGGKTVSLRSFRTVRPGTEGAVSAGGTAAGLAAAGFLAALGWTVGLCSLGSMFAILGGALLGNLYEGILGSRRLLSHTWLNATSTVVGASAAVLLGLLGGNLG